MTDTSWGELYPSGGGRSSVPAGDYTVRVAAARTGAKQVYLDLDVLEGPEKGQTAQVQLYVPLPSDKGGFYFTKKVNGMLDGVPPAFSVAAGNGDREGAVNALADAVVGRTFKATLAVRGDDAGDYAGTNELEETSALDNAAPAPAAPAAAPAAPAAAPAAEAAPTAAPPAVASEDLPF